MECAHLLHKGVEIRVRVRHLLGDLVEALKLRVDLTGAHAHVLDHGLRLVELRLLLEDADCVSGSEASLAIARFVEPGHDLEDRGLARTVRTDHADLRAREEGHANVVEDHFVPVRLTSLNHLVDVLSHWSPSKVMGVRRQRRLIPSMLGHAPAFEPLPLPSGSVAMTTKPLHYSCCALLKHLGPSLVAHPHDIEIRRGLLCFLFHGLS